MTNERKQTHPFKLPLDPKGLLSMKDLKLNYDAFMEKKQYGLALKYLNFIKNKAPLNRHKDIIHLHNLYIELLLEIEDYPSLLNILKSKEKYLQTNKDKAMHHFYEAIAYEGLNRIQDAIDALEAVDETISRQNLTNKYLKLALLSLRKKDLLVAKENYQHALIFDPDKTNDICLLVESDIAFYQGQYIDAMKIYEDFFIKTNRQWSYLNRFIRISLALDRKRDAYDFYLRYKDHMANHASIYAKKLFYSEILPLLKTHYPQDYIEANNRLMDIDKRTPIHFDDFNYYHTILRHLSHHLIYEKKRDIIRDLMIDLDQSGAFIKLAYAYISNGEINLYHYSKKLLLERKIDHDHMIYEHLRKHESQETYAKDVIQGLDYVREGVDYLFVEAVEGHAYLMAYVSKDYFDLGKKLILLAKHILKEKINAFDLRNRKEKEGNALLDILDINEMAVFNLHDHLLTPLNKHAKTMIQTDKGSITYQDFQAHMAPRLYTDQFTDNQVFTVNYKDQSYKLTSVCQDYHVFLMFSAFKETEVPDHKPWQAHANDGVVLLDIRNHHQLKDSFGMENYDQIFDSIENSLDKLSNRHMKDMLMDGRHLIYVLLDTRDKRIPERLGQKVQDLLGPDFDLRLAYVNFNQDLHQTKRKLNHMIGLTSKEKPYLLSEKPLRLYAEQRHLYKQNIQNMLKQKQIKLIDYRIKDWTSDQVKYHYIDVDDLNLLTHKDILNQIFNEEAMAINFDRLIVNHLIQYAKDLAKGKSWILPIHPASIKSKKAFNYLLRRLSILKEDDIIICLDHSQYHALSKKDKDYLKDKGMAICIKHVHMDLQTLSDIEKLDYLILGTEIFNHPFSKQMIEILNQKFNQIIYDHGDQNLSKASLKTHEIKLIMGDFSGKKNMDH